MRVVRIDRDRELALCATGEGERQSVEIALVQPVVEGDTAAGPRRHRDRPGRRGGGAYDMHYVDEFRDAEIGRALAGEILASVEPGRHYKLMEVCGGHTHSIYKYGIDDLLPENVELVHGPGCPVCVIPMGRVDDGIAIAQDRGRDLHLLRRHDARARVGEDLHRRQGRGGRHPDGLLAARRAADRQAEPRSRRRLLRDRLRDHGAVHRADAEARQGRGRHQLLLHVQPRHDRAAAAGAARLARPAARRLHRPRARLDRGRRAAVRVHPGRLRQADRRLGLRAARHPPVDPDDPRPARRRAAARSRTSTRGWSPTRATPRRSR